MALSIYRIAQLISAGKAQIRSTIASVGTAGAAVIKDNQTVCVAAGATNDIVVGKPLEIATDGVWVEIL